MDHTNPPYRLLVVSALACVVGVVATGAAAVLIRLISLFTNLAFHQRFAWQFVEAYDGHLRGWVYAVPLLGAALVGPMIKYGSSQVKGHGIPEAMEAVLHKESRIHPKVALLKPISAALTIGTGSPFGAEGPIIQTGGALGSLIGQGLPVSHQERKVLLACGAAAGTVAIFNTPIAAVLLATEVLLFEFAAISLVPVVIAGSTAYFARIFLFPTGLLFTVPPAHLDLSSLGWLIAFGIIGGLISACLTRALYFVEDLFEMIPGLDDMTRPVIGTLIFVGLALIQPRILGVGYSNIGGILSGKFGLVLLTSLFVFKGAGWLIALGSGTSGGVLAPLFIIGGSLGGILGHVLYPYTHIPAGVVAVLMMAAVFGASAHAMLTAAIFAAELTGDFQILMPLILVTAIADAVASHALPYSMMTGKLLRRGVHVPDRFIGILEADKKPRQANQEENQGASLSATSTS